VNISRIALTFNLPSVRRCDANHQSIKACLCSFVSPNKHGFGENKRRNYMSEFMETTVDKFTFRVAADRFYTPQGLWALASNGSTVRIGMSDFLQQRSGDIAFADVRPAGTVLAAGDEVAAIETIKVTITLPSPIFGTVLRVNPLMVAAPETINQDPYGEGWLCEIETTSWETDRKNLLEPAAYFTQMKDEAENQVKKNE
jgi:glycine cleavage system H protein